MKARAGTRGLPAGRLTGPYLTSWARPGLSSRLSDCEVPVGPVSQSTARPHPWHF
jgi:hypothetical protein